MGTRAARIGAGIVLALGIGILCPAVLCAMGADGADMAHGDLTWPLLAAGLLAAALGAGWVVSAARCRGKIERLVSARTHELSEMNERLRRQARLFAVQGKITVGGVKLPELAGFGARIQDIAGMPAGHGQEMG